MGSTGSAQRDGNEDAVAEEQSGQVDDAQTEMTEDMPLKNIGQMSGIHGKTDCPAAEVNGHCEDEAFTEVSDTSSAIVSPKEDVPETEEPLKDEQSPLEKVEINEKESRDADDEASPPPDTIETEAKLNEINEISFRRFFSNIGLKLTVKKGSGEKDDIELEVPVEGEPSGPDDAKDTTQETSQNGEQNIDLNTAQETPDNDSTTCPTLTDMTSEDIMETAEERYTETTEATEVASDKVVEALTTSTFVGEEEKTPDKDTTTETETATPSPCADEECMSPIKKFFTTGIFSGFRKKKKPAEEEKATDETTEKELAGMEGHEAKTEETGQIKEGTSPGVVLQEEILPDQPSTVIINEAELLSSQEKIKVQGSPLKRLLSASSLKKLSKKQRGRKSSDPKVTDSGEHGSDHLLSSTESAECQREESPARSPGEVAEEDGTWASFKKLVTPKKRMKRLSLSNEEAAISGSLEEPKPGEDEQLSDLSAEEMKKRRDSSVSWDAFLCGSGKRRSRKTSDSEEEAPPVEGDGNRPDDESRHAAHSPEDNSNEGDERAASPLEGDGGSTWKSLKRLVTPKRKVKDEEESKESIPSDSETTKDESSFSIKKLLPGRKKRKSTEKQEQVSSDEADRVGSDDEDSETPAVVPLSEFDTFETEDQAQTQAVIESHIPKAEDHEPQQNLSGETAEPVLSSDGLHAEPKSVQDNDNALEKQASKTPASNEELEDLTETVSKHQQLSDIPEEGVIEESMATPASATEEAARDDTIAEDLIELTSEAFTAQEPVDSTLADETEMVSAVSQLTESSKTSGNTTPVPAEYDVKETDVLLHQVVETISVTPTTVTLCLNELHTETIVGSVSPQILGTSVQQRQATILESHQRSDATVICTGLSVEEFDAVNELLAIAQTECLSDVSEAISTEVVSEVSTAEFNTAGIVEDEIHHASVSQPQASMKEFESADESQPLVECVSEGNEAVSAEVLPKDEEIGTVDVATVPNQAETQSTEVESRDTDATTAVMDETKIEAVPQTDQALEKTEDRIIENAGDQVQVEDRDQIPEVVEELQPLTIVQEASLNSEQGSAQVPEKQVPPEDVPAAETMNESKQEVLLTEVNVVAAKEDELQSVVMDAAEAEHAPVPETIQAAVNITAEIENKLETALHVATANVEQGSAQELEKRVLSEDIAAETDNATSSVTDESKQEALLTEVNVVAEKEDELSSVVMDAAEAEHAPVPETTQAAVNITAEIEDSVLEPEKQVILEDVPTSVTGATESEVVVQLDQAEDEVNIPEVVVESQTLIAANIDVINAEESSVQVIFEDNTPVSGAESVRESEVENETAVSTDQVILEREHRTLENGAEVPQHIVIEDEGHVAEVAHELQAVTAVHVAAVASEESSAQVLEEQVLSEDIPVPCADNASASVTAEPVQEVHLTEDNVQAEKESELPGAEVEAAAAERAPLPEVITSNLTDVVASTPDAAMENTSQIIEPLIDVVTNESQEPVMILPPVMKDDMVETGDSVVVVMHVPVQFEESHRIQVQVVNDDIQSAETTVETVLEVGVTDVKEVIDVCHEADSKVENLSAALEIEKEIIDSADKVIIQEVTQHEKLPEVSPEAVGAQSRAQNESVVLGQEGVQPPVVPSGTAAGELSEVSDKGVTEDSGTCMETQAEEPAVTSSSTAELDASQDTPHVPVSLDASILGLKEEHTEETKEELKKESDVDIIAEASVCSSEEAVVKKLSEDVTEEQRPQTTPEVVVPENTELISSVGNVESPSSLSLEPVIPIIEATEPMKPIDVPEVAVPVAEAVEPVRESEATETAESQKHIELPEVAAVETKQTTEQTTQEGATILNQPVVSESGVQAKETAEPVEQIKPIEKVMDSQPEPSEAGVQATEVTQPVTQTETTAGAENLNQAVNSGETKAVQQIEEERVQDVSLDAEGGKSTSDEAVKCPPEALEPLERQKTENDQEEKRMEQEMAQHPHTGEGESQQETPKTIAAGELKSEGEDVAVALEHPEATTASATAAEGE